MSNFHFNVLFWFFIILGTLIIFSLSDLNPINYDKGYKQGQVDYQKGVVKYKVYEVTTDLVKEIK